MLVLTQLDYTSREDESEVPYGCCPLSDPTYLLWHLNRPAGMCSLKRKGQCLDASPSSVFVLLLVCLSFRLFFNFYLFIFLFYFIFFVFLFLSLSLSLSTYLLLAIGNVLFKQIFFIDVYESFISAYREG